MITGLALVVHVENLAAWHNIPIGTKENGIAGMDTEFKVNSPLHVRQVTLLADYAKKGLFTYAGRRNEGEAKFFSGECAMVTSSSAAQANIKRNAKFDFSVNMLPYHDDIKGAPQNSIIGGASLWVMGGKTNNSPRHVLSGGLSCRSAGTAGGVASIDRLRADHHRCSRHHQKSGFFFTTRTRVPMFPFAN